MSKLLEQVDEYLAGRLQGDALDDFETQLLKDLNLQKFVIQQTQLKEGLTESASDLLGTQNLSGQDTLWQKAINLLWQPQVAYALSLVLFATALLPGSVGNQNPSFVDEVADVDQTRSDKQIDIKLVMGSQYLLALDLNHTEAVNVLLNQGNKEILSSLNVAPSNTGSLNFIIPELEAGQYQLAIVSPKFDRKYNIEVRPKADQTP